MRKIIKAHAAPTQTKAVSLRDAIFDEMIPHLTKISSGEQPISTGFKQLDSQINGFRPGELTIVGARPAMGKTSFVLGMALNVAKSNKKALFISEDMSNVQLCSRVISIEGKIEGWKITRTGQLSAEEWLRLPDISEKICDLPLFFVENTGFNRTFSVKMTTDLARKMKADIVFFDFLPDDAGQLKQMATMLNVPVVATCRVRRPADSRGPCTRPRATDLRAPDTVLMDADVILLLYREDYYTDFSLIIEEENVVPVVIIIAKANYGAIGSVDLLFHRDYVYFSESNEVIPW